jgi:hypothetical protein
MSFHCRKYYTHDFEYKQFSTNKFKTDLADDARFIIVENHLFNPSQFKNFGLNDNNVCKIVWDDIQRLHYWQNEFPQWLENKEFKKWVFFLRSEEIIKSKAKMQHIENSYDEEITWSHAKKNTMKLFFNDRDEEHRELPENKEKLKDIKDPKELEQLTENVKKFEKFIYFIKHMSNEGRQFDKCQIKERVINLLIKAFKFLLSKCDDFVY